MAELDPRVETIRKEYGLEKSDFWELPQKKGSWCVKHAALEVVAAKAKITFAPPVVLEADSANGVVSILVTGTMGDRSIWSIGECSPKNNRNAYPWAMGEKRGVDRVILKLVGIHGLVYSEDEMPDEPQRTTQIVHQEQPKPEEPKRLSKDASRSSFSEVSEAFRTAETLDALDAAGKRYKPKINEMHAEFEAELKELFKSFRADLQDKPKSTGTFKRAEPDFSNLDTGYAPGDYTE